MDDIKQRTEVCRVLIENTDDLMTPRLRVEFVALQLRRILEQIAISSFVANKKSYEKAYQKLGGYVSLKNVTKDLERIHPSFFPEPRRINDSQHSNGSHHADFLPGNINPLTKKELKRAHERCNNSLHSRNPFAEELDDISQLQYFVEILEKCGTLLSEHFLHLAGTEDIFYCIMSSPPSGHSKLLHLKPDP